MRLTLRTLLAYMDDILDPADHEDLGKKIEASDFAAELIHRSRDTVRRLRLGAPEVFAGEDDDVLNPDPASDANSVAEYLDNTLPPEHVAEFERVCLDSGTVADMHLAEVTSCHHVLTMVLGEPAEIDPQARRRMYELPSRVEGGDKLRIEAAHPGATVAAVEPVAPQAVPVVVPVTPPPTAETAHAVLPDYLQVAANRRRRGRRWATLVALFLIGGAATYLIIGAMEEPEVPGDVAAAVNDNDSDDFDIGAVEIGGAVDEPSNAEQSNTADTEAPAFVPDAAPADRATADSGESESVDQPSDDQSLPTNTGPRYDDVAPEETDPAPDSGPSLVSPTFESDPESEKPSTDRYAEATGPLDLDPAESMEAPDDVETGTAGTSAAEGPLAAVEPTRPLPPQGDFDPAEAEESATTGTIPGDPLGIEGTEADDSADDPDGEVGAFEDADEEESPPEPVGPKQLGVYVGNNDVLLRLLPDTEQWVRLPPRTFVTADNTLLSLPKYRTHVVLKNVNAYLSGGTQITVPDQDDSDASSLSLEMAYGRLLLNAGLKGSDISLKIGEHTREFHLDNSASLAIEVNRIFVPGTDYAQVSAPVQIDWYLTSGSVAWSSTDGTNRTIKAPMTWQTVNGSDDAPQAIADLPKWIDREPMSDLERRARDRFSEDLAVGEPVGRRLQELNEEQGAGREIRTLSAEASLYVGEFEPFIKSLNDSDQRVAWRSHINAMRQAMAMSPRVSEKLSQEFIDVRGRKAGEELMSMVRGFTPEQIGTTREELKQGVVIDLLRWLEDNNLDYRVLAIFNLDEIKGTRDLKDYRPDGIPRTRSIAVTKIREMIEDNEFLDLP